MLLQQWQDEAKKETKFSHERRKTYGHQIEVTRDAPIKTSTSRQQIEFIERWEFYFHLEDTKSFVITFRFSIESRKKTVMQTQR